MTLIRRVKAFYEIDAKIPCLQSINRLNSCCYAVYLCTHKKHQVHGIRYHTKTIREEEIKHLDHKVSGNPQSSNKGT